MRDPFEGYDVSARRALLVTLVLVGLLLLYAIVEPTVAATVAVILAFFVMIMLHELGHFLTAKRAGMKVTEFFVGFGPRVWSFRRGETEYGLKAVPLGGYCKIVGMTNLEDIPPAEEASTYRSKGYLAKLMVAGAGSAMHFLIALVLMFAVLLWGGNWPDAEILTTLEEVQAGQPAAEAGIRAGDRLVAIDGDEIAQWADVPGLLHDRGGDTVPFVVERDGELRTFDVALAQRDPEGNKRGYAGIQGTFSLPRVGFFGAVTHAPGDVYEVGKASIGALGHMFSLSGISNYVDVLSGDDGAKEDERFVSPVGFGKLASDAVKSGWVNTLGLLIAINVFVGLFNLVPLLPFDGGHIAIATYEKAASLVRRRRVQVDVAKLIPVTVFVIGVLGFIFLSSLFLDLSRPIDNPF